MEIATVIHANLETPLVLTRERVQLLVVEEPHTFYRYVCFFESQLDGGDGELQFLRNGAPIRAEKEGCFAGDPFHLDANERKLINQFYKDLERSCMQGALAYRLASLNEGIAEFLTELLLPAPARTTFDELTAEDILKACSVRFEKNYDTLLERIADFIHIMTEIKGCKFFVFVNLKAVLSDEDLHLLYHECELEGIGLLLLESGKGRGYLPEEKCVLITEDLCEILANYGET